MLIGIIGQKQSGKSTVGEAVSKTLGATVTVPMAAPIKDMLMSMGVPMCSLYGSEEQKNAPLDILCGKTGRQAMQTLGSEWGRDMMGIDIWVRIWKSRAKFLLEDGDVVVCDDVRRYDEAMAVEELGGHLILVVRPGQQPVDLHQSERYINELPFHYKIVNDGTPEELRAKVQSVMEEILEREARNKKVQEG